MTDSSIDQIDRAKLCLEGLAMGDAFGERFFHNRTLIARIWQEGLEALTKDREFQDELGPPPWPWTDDTAMAISIVATLQTHQCIKPQDLAMRFSTTFRADPHRGYGLAMHSLLPHLRRPKVWEQAPRALFGGQGSYGNGAAMRVAPIGAYFAEDPALIRKQAQLSARVTHTHPEASAGAIAVAVAAGRAWQLRGDPNPSPSDFLKFVLAQVPPSAVADMISASLSLHPDTTADEAGRILGNGDLLSAQDTVPFVVWCAAHHLSNYEEALWHTVSALGDMDTTCAMVGGIVVLSAGHDSIPAAWLRQRETLPKVSSLR